MAKKKEADEAQQVDADQQAQDDLLEKAQQIRHAYHTEAGREDPKGWEDLSPEKQQRWLDEATAATA